MTFKPGDRVKVVSIEPGSAEELVGREGTIVREDKMFKFDWIVSMDGKDSSSTHFYTHELELVVPEFEFNDWNDKGDRVVDVWYTGDDDAHYSYSSMVDEDAEALESRIKHVERAARAMLAWAEYVRKNPETPK